MEAKTYRELAEAPNMLMYSGNGPVYRTREEPSIETVHFIFNTVKDSNGVHQGILVDKNYDIMSNKVMLFATFDEFFGLANYMLRNGMAVTK